MSSNSSFLLHQLTTSKQDLSSPWSHNQIPFPQSENPKLCLTEKVNESKKSWYFAQSVTKIDSEIYVHPYDKHSVYSLNTKSLEMCTESLGCETGNGIDSNKEEYSYLLLKKQSCIKKKPKTGKVKQSSSFPPPLNSISGSDGVQVTTHRKEGRLVIKAKCFSSSKDYFQTERENGRLRLSLPKANNEEVDEEEGADYGILIEEQLKEEEEGKIGRKIGNGEWSSSRCNGDRSGNFVKLPFCVAIT